MNIPNLQWNYRRLTEKKHPFLLDEKAVPRKNEIRISSFLIRGSDSPECLHNAAEDLLAFCREALRLNPEDGRGFPLHLSIRGEKGRNRDYRMEIGKEEITIHAATAYGAVCALFRLQNQLRLRRAPFLRKGVFDSRNALDPALTHPAFKSASTGTTDWPFAYPDGYLLGIARNGYTGFHLNLRMDLFSDSEILPELACRNAEKNREQLRNIINAADRFGLDVFLSLYLVPLPGNHALFSRHPELRGSRLIGTKDRYVLCSSHPLTLRFYAQEMRALFRQVPNLAGVIAISGCEGWLHCHTACAQNPDGSCDCPRCRKIEPEQSVAAMFAAMADAVAQSAPGARFIVWNYGIFSWTDIGAEKLIAHLPENCSVMANFDTGDSYRLEGARGVAFDYSLRCVGPSQPCLRQKEAAEKRGLEFMVKTESGASLEFCSLNCIPALSRWMRKYRRIRQTASGALFNWKFLGCNGELAQELAGLTASGETERILERLAIRDFGRENLRNVLCAWREFDRAMEHHPFSNPSAGYFKGPFFIGPAQPLFLTPPDKLPPLFKNGGNSMVMTDLTFVEPFGVKAFLKALKKMEKHWADGLSALDGILPPEDAYRKAKIHSHLSLCRLFLCYIRTARHMTEFYALRESLHLEPYTPESVRETFSSMRRIAQAEQENTTLALQLLHSDKSLAFSYTYHYGISEAMCRFKLRHTEHLLQVELPRKFYGMQFAFNQRPCWTGKEF